MAAPARLPLQPPVAGAKHSTAVAPLATRRAPAALSRRVVLGTALVKLTDLNPLLRNDNTVGSVRQNGVGPHGIWRGDDGSWQMITEVYSDIGGVTNNGQTGAMRANAPSVLQGPWSFSPSSTLVITPAGTATWEYLEYSPHQPDWDAANNRWIMTAHGGNNQGPRQIGLTYSTDGKTGNAWSKDAGNPIYTPGASGAIDDNWLADLRWNRNPDTGRLAVLYRAQKVGGGSDGTVARMEGPALDQLTKTGGVITAAPSWATTGYHVGDMWRDQGGRIHHFGAHGSLGIGYSYSDDEGQTFTWGNNANPVLQPSGVANTSDRDSAGGTLRIIPDGDVLFLTYHASNLTDAVGGIAAPLRGASGAITPAACVCPARPGKFHLPGSRTIVDTAAANAIVSPLNITVFSMCGRFRAYRTARASFRRMWSETTNPTNSSIQFFISIAANTETGGGVTNAGKFHLFFRTPGGIVEFLSSVPVDDAFWHTWLLRRIGLASFELYIDDALVGTSSVSATLNSTATEKCIGNNPVVSAQDHPTNMTQSNVHLCSGYAMTTAEAAALMGNGTAPSSGTLTVNWPALPYSDSGNVIQVDATLVPVVVSASGTASGVGSGAAAGVALALAAGAASAASDAQAASGTGTGSSGTALGFGDATGAAVQVAQASGNAAGVGGTGGIGQAQAQAAGAATGAGVASGTAIALAPSVGAASGTGQATATAQATANASGSGTGTGAATAPATATASASGSSSGTGLATATGQAQAQASATAAGTGSGLGTGVAMAQSVGLAAGTGNAAATDIAIAQTSGVAAGAGQSQGSTDGTTIRAAAGSASGVGTAGAAGQALASASGSAAGIGSQSGSAIAIASNTGTATGSGNAAGQAVALTTASGAAAATGAVSGASRAIAQSAASATGTGTAAAIAAGGQAAPGNSAGVGAANATAIVIVSASGTASGSGAASATAAGVAVAAGNSNGIGATNVIDARAIFALAGTAAASGNAAASGRATVIAQGNAGGLGGGAASTLLTRATSGNAGGHGGASGDVVQFSVALPTMNTFSRPANDAFSSSRRTTFGGRRR